MILPNVFHEKTDWVIVGPLGPKLPQNLTAIPILAVDGGIQHAKHFDFWIGDGDSGETPQNSLIAHKLPEDKDKSDLGCALDLFPLKANYHLHLWGFQGGRRDHELFVMGEIHQFLLNQSESKCSLYHQDGSLVQSFYSAGEWKLELNGLFSLGVLEKAVVEMSGSIQYQVTPGKEFSPLSSLGLSNVGKGPVKIKSNKPFFICYTEKA